MPRVEIEIRQVECARLAHFIIQKGPIPVPTLALLGAQRLISRPLGWQQPLLGEAPPGFLAPPGTLPMRAGVTITHASLDELEADAAAPGTATPCTAWLLLRCEPFRSAGGPVLWIDLRVDLLRLESAGRAPQTFSPPLPIGRQSLPPLSGVSDLRGAVVLFADEVVTLRLGVGADEDLLAPPQSVLAQEGSDDQWLIRVAGDVFAAQVRDQLAGLKLPGGTRIETPAEAYWAPLPAGMWTTETIPEWGVLAGMEIEQVNACAGHVDVSVDVGVVLGVTPRFPIRSEIDLALRVTSDVSDWDSLRCWLVTGGLGSLGLTAIGGLATGIVAAVASLVTIGEFIRWEVGKAVTGASPGGGFTLVPSSSDETTAWYTRTIPLPALPIGSVSSVTVDARGLVVRGTFPFLVPLDHTITFVPEGGPLGGHWHGSYSCRERRWRTTYEVASVVVHDRILDARDPAASRTLEGPAVTIFPTTTFRHPGPPEITPILKPGFWFYDGPPAPTGAPIVTPRRSEPPGARERVMFFLHTSAGLRRYDIGPVPPVPRRAEEPPPLELALQATACRQTTRHWTPRQRIEWWIDPPPFNFGLPPLRQWLLTLTGLPREARVVTFFRGGEQAEPQRFDFHGRNEGFVELLSGDGVVLDVEHSLSESEAEVRMCQRWLVPTRVVPLPRPASGLRLARTPDGTAVVVIDTEERAFALAGDGFVEWTSAPPSRRSALRSLTLPSGQVAVVRGDELVLAVPWGRRA